MINLRASIAGLLVAVLTAVSAQAATWDMPTPYGEDNFHTVNIKAFADDVKKRSSGALDIKVHSGGSLFKHPEIKNAIRSGQVPIGEFLLSRLANENAVYEVDSVPFLATSYDQARELWDASRGPISRLLDSQGLVLLFAVPWPPQGLYANKPLNSVADMQGLKFRAYNPATERLAQLAGAVPTQVEVADLAQAFATGRVESMITSPSTGANNKAWDYVSHFYNTQAWLPKNAVVINKQVFDALPENARTALLNAAAAAEARGWDASRSETENKTQALKEGGMIVEDPSPELAEGLKEIGGEMSKEWAEKAGEMGGEILLDFNK